MIIPEQIIKQLNGIKLLINNNCSISHILFLIIQYSEIYNKEFNKLSFSYFNNKDIGHLINMHKIKNEWNELIKKNNIIEMSFNKNIISSKYIDEKIDDDSNKHRFNSIMDNLYTISQDIFIIENKNKLDNEKIRKKIKKNIDEILELNQINNKNKYYTDIKTNLENMETSTTYAKILGNINKIKKENYKYMKRLINEFKNACIINDDCLIDILNIKLKNIHLINEEEILHLKIKLDSLITIENNFDYIYNNYCVNFNNNDDMQQNKKEIILTTFYYINMNIKILIENFHVFSRYGECNDYINIDKELNKYGFDLELCNILYEHLHLITLYYYIFK